MIKVLQKKSHQRNNGKNYVIFPIVFVLISYLLIFIAAFPIVKPILDTADLFFLDRVPSVSEKESIFKGAPSIGSDTIKLSKITFPSFGVHYGHITIPSTSVDADLYYGDSSKELKNGVGTYGGSFIPGYHKTTMIAGHNHTYFHTLGKAEVGDKINIETNYGKYVYEVTDTKIADKDDDSAYDLSKEEENIILYTCYPFDVIGLTKQRYFVYAKYISGPMLDVSH